MDKKRVEIDKTANQHTPRAGDGTQPAAKAPKRANWYGASDRPQEEFIGDQANRADSDGPPASPIPPGQTPAGLTR